PTAGDTARSGEKRRLTRSDIDAMMTSLSNWGRWGREDQLGALNLITPTKRREAAALVTEGITISLAHNLIKVEIDAPPAFVHRKIGLPKADAITGAMDEYSVRYHGFTQTHLDGLCHLIYKGKMYNGFPATEVTATGARKLGVEQIKSGIFTRG